MPRKPKQKKKESARAGASESKRKTGSKRRKKKESLEPQPPDPGTAEEPEDGHDPEKSPGPADEQAKKSDGETSLAVSGSSGPIERVTPLQHYLAEVSRHPLLTRDEEVELAKDYRERGDLDAARRLVTSNLRLVVKIALEYYRQWMDLLDLIQEGNLGLMQAVKKFDPYRGIRLSTYSSFWIRAYILKFLMDNWRLVKIGTTQAQRKLFFNLKKEKERLERFGFKPDAKMLAESLNVKESEVKEMNQRLSSRDESLETPVSEDGRKTREDTLSASGPAVDEQIAEDEFVRIIRRKLGKFRKALVREGRDKDAFIFDNRLLAEEPMTLHEVGDKFGVSRERVRQLEARIIKQLKAFLKEELPDYEDYDFILQ
jgi:RNA polymerase sigma-32 factor